MYSNTCVTMLFLSPQRWNLQSYQSALGHTLNNGLSNVLVSLILIKSVSTGAEICCRFCQALPSDPYRLGCGTVSLTVSYKRTNKVESTLIQPHDIETMLIQHCCVRSGKPFQNIGVGRFRKFGGGGGGGGGGSPYNYWGSATPNACPPSPPPPPPFRFVS